MKKNLFGLMMALLMGCSTDKTLSPAEQLQKDVAAIDKYLADNTIVALKDPSGLRYVIATPGTGPSPTLTSIVTVTYKGTYLGTTTVFDQATTATNFQSTSYPSGAPLITLIQGWQIGFQLLSKGAKATLYIPSGLAYGTAGSGPIPANSNLVFEVELLSFK